VFQPDFFQIEPDEILEVYDRVCQEGPREFHLRAFAEAIASLDMANTVPRELLDAIIDRRLTSAECWVQGPDAEALYMRGVASCIRGRYTRAIEDFNRALQLNPRLAGVLHWRGNGRLIRGEYDKAIEDFTLCIEVDPQRADAYVGRAADWLGKGQYDRAIDDSSLAIANQPSNVMAYCRQGAAWLLKGEAQKAIQLFSRAIEIDPGFARAYGGRYEAFLRLGEAQSAARDLESLRKRDRSGVFAAFFALR
jgi:tetratricopeptide (TPR) repeat protein